MICVYLICGANFAAKAQYRFDVLNTDMGLPQNSAKAVLQTHDGYIWISTLDGLVRYDGARFTVFNKANSKGILSNRFLSLYEDTDGTLWIGTEDGGLTRYRDGQFHTYTTADGLPHAFVLSVRRTPDGTLLALTAGGLARLRGERFEVISTDPNSFDSDIGIQGPSGSTWYRVNKEVRRVKDGQVTSYAVPSGGRGTLLLNQLYEDHQGRLWIGTYQNPDGELWMLKDGVMTRYSVRDGLPRAPIYSFYEDSEGTMWFGADGAGLVRFKDGKFTTYTKAQGLASNDVEAIFEDREGSLWVGSRDNGVTHISRQVITTLSEKDGLKGKIFYPILEDHEGGVWMGNVGVNRYKDGKFTYYPLDFPHPYKDERRPFIQVTSLYEGRDGVLHIGDAWGVDRFQNGAFTYDEQLSERREIYAMLQDSQGAFWLGSGANLLRYQNGVKQHFTSEDGLRDFVQPIYEDSKGRIWIGSYGGLAQYVDGHLVFLTEKDGLSSNRVRAIYEDGEGVLWVGTYDGGLNRYKDGKFTAYTMKEGMFSNGVFAILEDGRGNFWMSSNQGIYRVSRQQLNDFADGKITKIHSVSYGKADGMLSTECNGARQPSAIKTRDGRLWFPTFDGIAIVNSGAITFNDVEPPVLIENVILDGVDRNPDVPIDIKPGQENLTIQYTALSFIKSGDIQFKYKLDGLDTDWVDAGNRREAYYPHLPAGEYTFRVIAANSDGLWNEQGAAIRINVIPPVWRRWWFVTLASASLVTIIVLLFRARIKKLERAQLAREAFSRQLIDSQEQERKRIAAELHDSLGQSLIVIKNLTMMLLYPSMNEETLRQQVQEISSETSRAISEVKEISYNLRPFHLDQFGLTRSIESMIDNVAKACDVRFTADLDHIDGLLPPEDEINFYRIVQEGLNNVVKHSGATEAQVIIRHGENDLALTIKDNGKGFAPAAPVVGSRQSGFGLTGIGERAHLLNGEARIHSEPGQGTTVFIKINLKGKPDER